MIVNSGIVDHRCCQSVEESLFLTTGQAEVDGLKYAFRRAFQADINWPIPRILRALVTSFRTPQRHISYLSLPVWVRIGRPARNAQLMFRRDSFTAPLWPG